MRGNLGLEGIFAWARLHPVWLTLPGFATVAGVVCLLVLRQSRIHRTQTDHQFHELCHNLRDHAARVLGDGEETNGKWALFSTFNQKTAKDMPDSFRVLTGDPKVACAIRLALKSQSGENQSGEKQYKTFGRSSGYGGHS